VTIFDPKATWTYAVSKSRSLARNSPFDGRRITGRVVATIVSGNIVYRSS
jgi:dihydroorotase